MNGHNSTTGFRRPGRDARWPLLKRLSAGLIGYSAIVLIAFSPMNVLFQTGSRMAGFWTAFSLLGATIGGVGYAISMRTGAFMYEFIPKFHYPVNASFPSPRRRVGTWRSRLNWIGRFGGQVLTLSFLLIVFRLTFYGFALRDLISESGMDAIAGGIAALILARIVRMTRLFVGPS